jgi:dihydrofolate reductase
MPKVILYMASSLNGMIAKEDDDTSFVSESEWQSYVNHVTQAGNLVIGHRTYNLMKDQAEFNKLNNIRVIIVSHETFDTGQINYLVATSPQEAIKLCAEEKEVIVAGGGMLNAAFMENNLIDEIYLDIEPITLGNGIKLFNGNDFERKLKLLGINYISNNEVQLHYQVIK